MALPILRLRVSGSCSAMTCGAAGEGKVSTAACLLQNLPISWYRRVKPKPTASIKIVASTETDSNENLKESDSSQMQVSKCQRSFFQKKSSPKDGVDSDDEKYIKFDAVLSVCDTDLGPAIELRTTSKALAGTLERYDFTDVFKKMDTVLHLSGNEISFPILERIIPLSMIDCAALGGTWELDNILNLGGSVDCGIKVYSCE
jgi:hypothetical protein